MAVVDFGDGITETIPLDEDHDYLYDVGDYTEYEELIRLRAEITYIKAENEAIKKEIALREEKEAALLKAKKQRLSKNSEKKDIN